MDGLEARPLAGGGARAEEGAAPPFASAPEGARACDCSDVGAYLDGELGVSESESFESHLKSCPACSSALSEQRRLLSLLDAAFHPAPGRQVALPADFTRVAVARAQSDMTRVRRRSEKGRALALSAGLAALSFALLGAQFWGEVAALVGPAAHAASAFSEMSLHAGSSAASGARVVLRGFGGYLLQSGTAGARLFVYAALACAFLLLLRLIGKYRRSGLPD